MGLTREQLFKALNIVKEGVDLEAITKKAMFDYENEHWRNNLENAPHGAPWHTSFHASSFPGDNKACIRKLVYTMMDIPDVEPAPMKLRGQAEMGKAVEAFIISKWKFAGILLGEQVKFEMPDIWFTGSADAVLDLRPKISSVVPVDIKSKDHDKIQEMRIGLRSYDDRHYAQIQAYIFFCQWFHKEMGWDKLGLEPARSAILYYASRQDPTFIKEFFIREDHDFIQNALDNVELAKMYFNSGKIPERPKDWKWSEEPCKWCPLKKYACKPDDKDKIVDMSQSHGIEFAKHVRPDYDYDEKRKEVKKRWTKSSLY